MNGARLGILLRTEQSDARRDVLGEVCLFLSVSHPNPHSSPILQWQQIVLRRFWLIKPLNRNLCDLAQQRTFDLISALITFFFFFFQTLPHSRTPSLDLSRDPFFHNDRFIPRWFSINFALEAIYLDIMPPTGPGKRAALCRVLALASALLVYAASVSGCPHKCSCSGSHVDCQGLGLKTVPKGIPRNAERL